MEQLTTKALNRALLARQMLLKREPASPLKVIAHLGGLQAQQPRPPFTGLWSRIEGFQPNHLQELLNTRQVLRTTSLRGTLHLMTREDFLGWRPLLQPMLTAGAQAILRDRLQTFDQSAVLEHAIHCLGTGPRSFDTLRKELIAAFPDSDERAMGYFARMHLSVASLPDDDNTFELVPHQSRDRQQAVPLIVSTEQIVERYLGAFGPASVADFQAWSGIKGAQHAFDKMNLLTFTAAGKKRVLYDLPGVPRPDPDTPAPVRLIAEFDNLVLGHADRSRIVADEHRPRIVTKNLLVLGTFLVDGFVAGTWKRDGKRIQLEPFEPLAPKVRKALEAEADGLNHFHTSL